jgi:hypothetical protein
MPLVLRTPLPPPEVVRILRAQTQALRWHSRIHLFKARTSPVFAKIQGNTFRIESSADPFSKRLIGTFEGTPEGSEIRCEWKTGFWHRPYGHSALNEEVIIGFLHEWLLAKPVTT